MANLLYKVFLQPLVVVGGSHTSNSSSQPPNEWMRAAANFLPKNSGASDSNVVPQMENHFLRVTFSSVPIIWQSDIDQEYQDLGSALSEMTQVDDEDDLRIDRNVYQVACQVATSLLVNSYPAPRIFNHGAKSVVFNWAQGKTNLYLTISSDFVSVLLSSPERIKERIELSTKNPIRPSLLRGLLPAPLVHPVAMPVRSNTQLSGII
jgi:hypothetical protein